MTATTATAAPEQGAGTRVTFKEILDSEWLKVRSVRSTLWTMMSLIGVTIGFTALICAIQAADYGKNDTRNQQAFDPTGLSIGPGSYFGVIAALVLGVIVITGEYATGMIRTSLTAVPRRTMLFLGKAAALAAITLIASAIALFASYFIGQAIFSGKHLESHITDSHVLRAVIGGVLYLTIASLFAYAIGMLLRHTGGAITVAIAAIFVLPIVSGFFPSSWHVGKYTPSGAGMAIMNTVPQKDSLAPWTGFALFCLYAAVLLAAALMLFRKRDA